MCEPGSERHAILRLVAQAVNATPWENPYLLKLTVPRSLDGGVIVGRVRRALRQLYVFLRTVTAYFLFGPGA